MAQASPSPTCVKPEANAESRGSQFGSQHPLGHLRYNVKALQTLVETMGIEPTTPCLQSRCSSQLSYVPEG
jgi:hypothetical protein